jgi:hypothetical protein
MKKYFLMFLLFALSGCISPEERAAATYRMEQVLSSQCSQKLGFKSGTQSYMKCQMFYESMMNVWGISFDYASFYTSDRLANRISEQNKKCARYWGEGSIDKSALWDCIQDIGQKEIDEAAHQKELKEKEEMLTRSIAAGQTQANEEARLQERIDAERERVAKETGKNPKKIQCKTYHKSNGYIQVKCK